VVISVKAARDGFHRFERDRLSALLAFYE